MQCQKKVDFGVWREANRMADLLTKDLVYANSFILSQIEDDAVVLMFLSMQIVLFYIKLKMML